MAKNYFEASSGARSVRFYALSLKQIQDHEDALVSTVRTEEDAATDPKKLSRDRFLRYLPAFTLSAQRGDAAVTQDDVAAVVDMQNFIHVMRAAFGMADRIPEEDAQSQVPMSPRIGGDSTHV
jgi:hypothetical protein